MHKTKYRATRTPFKLGVNPGNPEGFSSVLVTKHKYTYKSFTHISSTLLSFYGF